MSRQKLWWKMAPAVFATLVFGACTQNLENNTAFQDQVSRVTRLEDDQKAIKLQIGTIESDPQKASQDIARLAAAGGGSPDAYKALEARLAELADQLKRTNEVVDAMSKRGGGEARLNVKPPAKEESGTPSALPPAPTVGKPAEPARPATAVKEAKPRPRTKPAETATRPAGAYYQVQQGDTMASIAAKHHTTVQKLIEANRLPAGTTVPVGQMIYIPAQ